LAGLLLGVTCVPPRGNRLAVEIYMRRKGISLTRENHRKNSPWVVRWWGRYDVTTGKCRRYGRVFERKKQAEDFIEDKLAEFRAGLPRDQVNITLEQLIEKYKKVRVSILRNRTAEAYDESFRRLKGYFGPSMPINRIDRETAEQFVSSLEVSNKFMLRKTKRLSDWSRHRYLRECKTLFQAACDWNYIRQNPFSKIKLPAPVKQEWHFITPDEFRAILEHAPSLQTKGIYAIMYAAGLRFGEAANLLWINIDLHNNRVNIVNRPATTHVPPFTLKDKQQRSVPLPKFAASILRQLKAQSSKDNPFVFLKPERFAAMQAIWQAMVKRNESHKWDSRMLVNNLLRTFKTCCEKAGIKTNRRLNLHCLRKAYGTNLANVSTPVQTLKALMGHSSIKTTMEFYLCSCDSNEKRAVAELDRIMQEPAEEQGDLKE